MEGEKQLNVKVRVPKPMLQKLSVVDDIEDSSPPLKEWQPSKGGYRICGSYSWLAPIYTGKLWQPTPIWPERCLETTRR